MKKKTTTDLLRFYGGDIREKTEYGIMQKAGIMDDCLWGDEEAYRTLNALLFDGYENEKERIDRESCQLNPTFIERLEETLSIYTGVFSLMCKCKDTDGEKVRVKRVDREASLKAYEKGYTGSFVSCTKGDYQEDFSQKNNVILLEAEILPGIPCADFQKLVSESEYSNFVEQEVLLPPFLPLDIEKISLSKRENKMLRDINGNSPAGKYLLKPGKFPDYRKEITTSMEELYKVLSEEKDAAAISLQKMNEGLWQEDYTDYIRWKEKLHSYLKLLYSEMWHGEEKV